MSPDDRSRRNLLKSTINSIVLSTQSLESNRINLRFTLFVGVLSFVNSKQEGLKVTICAGQMSYTRLSTFKSWVEYWVGQNNYCS